MRPPRALWVPFELGRPLGVPDDAAFQLDVLRSVLALFERGDGPVILEDYPHDAPGQGDPGNMEGLVCPIPLRKADTSGEPDIVRNVLAEIEQLAPWQALFRDNARRSTVGVGTLALPDAVRYLGDLLTTGRSERVAFDARGPALRFACEDLRNFYLEAARMRPGGAASTPALIEWFWGETSAAELLLALQPVCMASGDPEFIRVAEKMMIPRAQVHRLQA